MKFFKTLAATAVMSTVALYLTAGAYAQETTSSIRGTIFSPEGTPVTGAEIVVTDTRTGTTQRITTSQTGRFSATGLRVGGPYRVRIDTDQYRDQTVNDVFIQLGSAYTLNLGLEAGGASANVDELVVTASQVKTIQVAIGPSSTFSLADLQQLPAINRDIKDIIQTDPRILIDETNSDAVQCAGQNNRFNSLTVDGVRFNDGFGLNDNGFPTERLPFPFDAIDQLAVEISPFDVEYGGFSACNINVVTKSGANEFFGSAFFDFTNDTLNGSSLEGTDVQIGDFNEKRWGLTLGGPLVRDRLFFFVAYEEHTPIQIFNFGPLDSGFANEVAVSQVDIDRIADAARTVYGYDPGGFPISADEEERKILVKLDANVTDNHRVSFTYTNTDGNNIIEENSSNDELSFESQFYEQANKIESYVGQIFSNWTDNLSTEILIGYADVTNGQNSLGGGDFGEFRIETVGTDGRDKIIYLGSDDARHANRLMYNTLTLKAKADYTWRDHRFTVGYERETTDVSNLFIFAGDGVFTFSSIEDFEAGQANTLIFQNPPTLVEEDGAAEYTSTVNSIYIQDEWRPRNDLTVTAGLRYDWYTSPDAPLENQNFVDRYGFSNAEGPDGFSLIQPRIGFNWRATERTEMYGGIGRFSGGNPNVWISNNFSNDGQTLLGSFLGTFFGPDATAALNAANTPNFGFVPPQLAIDSLFGGDGDVNALDPDFKVPSSWKFNIGVQHEFDVPMLGDNFNVGLDFLYFINKDAAITRDLALQEIGTAPDGRPLYQQVDLLTCTPPNFDNPGCNNRDDEYLLTNSDFNSNTLVFSTFIDKEWELDSWNSRIGFSLGYAFTDAEDTNPMTSTIAGSNFGNFSTDNPNDPRPATSNYETPHRITLRKSYEKAFFGDYNTRMTLFGQVVKGRPFSYTFFQDNGLFGDSEADEDRQLLYIPSGPGALDDPIVIYDPDFDLAAFNAFVSASGLDQYRGTISPRNGVNSDWWSRFDIKIEQEVPGVREGHKGTAFFILENVANLINDEWGVFRVVPFEHNNPVVDARIEDGRYVYEGFSSPAPQSRSGDSSLWAIRIGMKYEF